jgi:mitochondrial pyruvate carrier 1
LAEKNLTISNFGIPIAAIADLTGKPEEKINGRMTLALTIYSATFMRYAWSWVSFVPLLMI